jgi:RNA polymerase sigma factor (sigma-70 family)
VAALREELVRYAAADLGPRGRQAGFEPDSVVQSVWRGEFERACERCPDDAGVRHWLQRAVKNEIVDRTRKKRADQLPADSAGAAFDPQDSAPGPRTELIAAEERRASADALERLLARLRDQAVTEAERTMLELFAIDRLSWREVAVRIGCTDGAARVKMNRLRGRILGPLFAPLRQRLEAGDWRIAELLLVDRQAEEAVATLMGHTASGLREAMERRIAPAIIAEFGAASVPLLLRLTGYEASATKSENGRRP